MLSPRFVDLRHLAMTLSIVAISFVTPSLAAGPSQTLVIAHRGASAYLPEHTLAAYALAYGQGADYLEPDVVLTKDGVAICNHDITLDRQTNIEVVFPDRARDDGKWYAIDFTLAEIRRLDVDGPPRHTSHGTTPPIGTPQKVPTLREMLQLVANLNKLTGRNVGVIPEPKRAAFHRAAGQSIETTVVKLLHEFDYRDADDRCVIQSFEKGALVRIRGELGSKLRLVFLFGDADGLEQAGGLRAVAEFAEGVGPAKKLVDASDGDLVREAHKLGLTVYPWTFTNDRDELRRFMHEYRVDGLFADYPDMAIEVRTERQAKPPRLRSRRLGGRNRGGAHNGRACCDSPSNDWPPSRCCCW